MLRKVVAACLLFFATSVLVLRAQDVFVMPGAASSGQSVAAFAASPLSEITSVSTVAGPFLTLTANGNYYIVGSSTSVTVTSSGFGTPTSIGSFSQGATGAAVSPNGGLLAVAAGTLHVFNTSGNAEVASSPVAISGVNVLYVAAGLDGKSFYTVGTTSSGSQLNAISTSNLASTGSLTISGTPTSITVGPNGLLYVATQGPNQLIEINPGTLSVTSGGLISLGGPPAPPAFTTDGQYLLLIAKNASLSSIVLSTHALASSLSLSSVGIPLDSIRITGKTNAAAFASQTGNLYQVTIGLNGILSVAAFPGVSNGLSAFTVSSEVPAGNVATKAALYASASGSATLYRVDLPTSTVTQAAFPSAITATALSYATALTTGSPSQLLVFGNNQTIGPSGTTLPLVVQALDGNGHPLSGVSVTFSANNSSAVVSPTAATTGADGFALTYLTASSTAGTVQVTATAGTQTAQFTVTVGSSSTGAAAGIAIVAGQGQLLQEQANTANAASNPSIFPGSSLVVVVTDSNGNPVSGATVTFAITAGGVGTLITSSGATTSATLTTGSNGQASVDYQAPYLGAELAVAGGFVQTTIQATNGSNSVNFYVTTIPGPGTVLTVADPSANIIAPTPGTTISAQSGQPVPLPAGAVQAYVVSGLGIPIPNVGITLNNGGLGSTYPSATCVSPGGVLTSSNGQVTCDLQAGPVIGTASINVVVGYNTTFTNEFMLSVTAGPPGKINIVQGNNQSGAPGQTLPIALKVQVTDASGNVLPGASVTFTPSSGVTLSSVSAATDSNGYASALATLGNVAGPATVTVTAGSVSATFTVTVNIAAAGLQKVSGDAQTALISTAFASPLVVEVVDSKGNPVQGAIVTFAVASGSATLGSASATTGSNGQASTTVTAGTSAGAISVTASAAGGFSVSFSLTSHLPGPSSVTIVNGASFLPGSVISPGGIATIIGTGIAPSLQGMLTADNIVGPLPTTLGGVSITFNGTAAPIYYVLNANGQQQVTVQVPFEVTPGSAVSVVINSAGGGTATVSTPVSAYAPGAFTTTIGGQTIAVATRPDGSYVSPTNTALQGENITFYVTGLGQTSPATGDGDSGIAGQQVTAPLIVGINNGGVPLISAIYAPGLVGVYAVTLQIPVGTTGNNVPFGLIATDAQGNQYWMQAVSIPVR